MREIRMFDFFSKKTKNDSFTQAFISYSFADKKIMNSLKKTLRSEGIDCYVAEHDENYGNSLSAKLSNAIDESGTVIVILTHNGSMSSSVNQEIGYAKKAGKQIIPLVEKGVNLPIMLQGTEYVKFDSENLNSACNKITRFLIRKSTESNYEEPNEESDDESIEKTIVLDNEEYEIYPFDLDVGDKLVGKIQSDEPINVYVVNEYGRRLFENDEEFNFQEGGERIKKTKINFQPYKVAGVWNVIIENEENDKVEVQIFLDVK